MGPSGAWAKAVEPENKRAVEHARRSWMVVSMARTKAVPQGLKPDRLPRSPCRSSSSDPCKVIVRQREEWGLRTRHYETPQGLCRECTQFDAGMGVGVAGREAAPE